MVSKYRLPTVFPGLEAALRRQSNALLVCLRHTTRSHTSAGDSKAISCSLALTAAFLDLLMGLQDRQPSDRQLLISKHH